jgi:hypothetical protein
MREDFLRPNEVRISTKNGKYQTDPHDPRPDLTEDSRLWSKLLALAWDSDGPDLFFTLHGFRCNSLRLIKGAKGYVLRPEFDARSGWIDKADYEAARDKDLMPHRDEVARLLRGLGA